MEKARKKLTDMYGDTKMRTVWKTTAKINTNASCTAFFFNEPVIGQLTQCVKYSITPFMHVKAIQVKVDDINKAGIVFCSIF